ncbi:hypothetical protein HY065_03260, partial [Candidatus Berkelbacteria bacterium]|nr:hypothetical protein [Candidatus Berkelbacteria bacterium]
IDSAYSPITKVNYTIDNTRVGQITNFDKVTLDIMSDGTIDPADALAQAAEILAYHFSFIAKINEPAPKKKTAKAEATEEGVAAPQAKAEVKEEKPKAKKSSKK